MSTSLNGLTALVTGSTSGIGRATADVLAQRGAYVILSGRKTVSLPELLDALSPSPTRTRL